MLTVKEVAKLVGYSYRHMARLCEEGKVKAEKFGPVYMVDAESAKAYAANPPRPGPRSEY